MFAIWWQKAIEEVVASREFPRTACPCCGQKGGLRLDISNDRLETFFWTISMPHKGFAAVNCEKCGQSVAADRWPLELKSTAEGMRGEHRNRFRLVPGKWFVLLLLVAIGGAFVGLGIRGLSPGGAEARFKEEASLESALAYPSSGTVLAASRFDGPKDSEGRYVLIEKADIPLAKGDFHETKVVIRVSNAEYESEDFYKEKKKFAKGDFGDEIEAKIDTSLVKAPLAWRDPASGKTVYYTVRNAWPDAIN